MSPRVFLWTFSHKKSPVTRILLLLGKNTCLQAPQFSYLNNMEILIFFNRLILKDVKKLESWKIIISMSFKWENWGACRHVFLPSKSRTLEAGGFLLPKVKKKTREANFLYKVQNKVHSKPHSLRHFCMKNYTKSLAQTN